MIETLIKDICVMMDISYMKERKLEPPKNKKISTSQFKVINIKKDNVQEQMTIDDILLGK